MASFDGPRNVSSRKRTRQGVSILLLLTVGWARGSTASSSGGLSSWSSSGHTAFAPPIRLSKSSRSCWDHSQAQGSSRSRSLQMKLRSKEETPGNDQRANFFVDRSCSNCGSCRSLCPGVYQSMGLRSAAVRDPINQDEKIAAIQAMVTCPMGAIRLRKPDSMVKDVIQRDFPIPIDTESLPDVYQLGYHHRESGAAPYLIVRPSGNIMIDVPRFNGRLASQIDRLGGLAYMIITHTAALADHDYWSAYFPDCKRVIHRQDRTRESNDIEAVLNGKGPWAIGDSLKIVHLPGHTLGSIGVIYTPSAEGAEPILFSGRTLGWSPEMGVLDGFAEFNEGSIKKQGESIKGLAEEAFAWVLPAHGARYRFANPKNKGQILEETAERFVERGRKPSFF